MPRIGLGQDIELPLRKEPMPRQLFCGRPGRGTFDPGEIESVRNRPGFNKPFGGVWTSTYTPHEDFCSDWVSWCFFAGQCNWVGGVEDCSILTVEEGAQVYEIDDLNDLEYLFDEGYGLGGSLDFEKLAKVIDGIHLTEEGQVKTRRTYPFNLYGWDSESTLWFRNVFSDVEPLAKDEDRTCELVTG